MMFPSDEILLARGKYSTLSSERRGHIKKLREDMESLANYARRILLHTEDIPFAQEELHLAAVHMTQASTRLDALEALEPLIKELKPLAWGKEKENIHE